MTINKIRDLCKANEISLTDLERKTHLANGTICKWEGKSPRIDNLQKVANYFGVTVDELLRDDCDDTIRNQEV